MRLLDKQPPAPPPTQSGSLCSHKHALSKTGDVESQAPSAGTKTQCVYKALDPGDLQASLQKHSWERHFLGGGRLSGSLRSRGDATIEGLPQAPQAAPGAGDPGTRPPFRERSHSRRGGMASPKPESPLQVFTALPSLLKQTGGKRHKTQFSSFLSIVLLGNFIAHQFRVSCQ